MAEDHWIDCALCQLWAEGVDWRALVPAAADARRHHVEEWLRHPHTLPRRKPFNYPGPEQTRLVVPLYERFVADLSPWLEHLWGGAMRVLPDTQDVTARLDHLAHWRLNLTLGKRLPDPEHVLELWAQHHSQVQDTPAEQQILEWYRAQEPWRGRWHPYREGAGAMRLAPIWGAVYCAAPEQAAAAAARDARITYGGWGVWTAAVVAWAVALGQNTSPAVTAETLMRGMTRVDPQHPGVAAINAVLRTAFPGESWEDWCLFIDTEFTGYPRDHSLVNLLLIIGALHWYADRDCDEMLGAIDRAGWDIAGNQLISATLMAQPRDQTDAGRDTLLHFLVGAAVKAHGHPPNV